MPGLQPSNLAELEVKKRAIAALIERLARDFGVEAPRLVFVETKDVERLCGTRCAACYNWKSEAIIFSNDFLDLEVALHEFAHHLQYVTAGKRWEKAFPPSEYHKPHAERFHEKLANEFKYTFTGYYLAWWSASRKAGGEERVRRDARWLCAFAATTLSNRAGALERIASKIGELEREGRFEEARRLAGEFGKEVGVVKWLAESAMARACGVSAETVEEHFTSHLEEAALHARVADGESAKRCLERAREDLPRTFWERER